MTADYSNVPEDLKNLPQWVVHQGKKPIDPNTYYGAKAGDPSTWGTFEQCLGLAPMYDGIGFELNDNGIVGIDIDHCIDEIGLLSKEARSIVERLNSYTEISPSGTGLHIWIYGDIPEKGRKHTEKGVEIYKDKRYFTMTGNVYGDLKPIEQRDAEIMELFDELFPQGGRDQVAIDFSIPVITPISVDYNLLDKIRASKQGDKFRKLYDHGDITGYPSQSEADLALCNILAFWCRKDAALMDHFFRMSGLMRKEKWDRKESGYGTSGNRTIQEAISKCTDVYTPKDNYSVTITDNGTEVVTVQGQQKALPAPIKRKFVKSADIKAVKKQWLIYPYFQKHKLGLIVGEAGSCKTQLTLKFAAVFSTGSAFWVENPMVEHEPKKVLYLSGEDAVDDTLKPRLEKMGANEENIYFDNGDNCAPLSFTSPEFEGMIAELKPEVIIFDPLQGYLETGTNANDAVQIRKQAMHLTALAEKYKYTPIGIMHPNKNALMKAADRISGSKEFVNVARSVLQVGKDPDDENLIHVAMSKHNGPKGMSFSFSLEKLGFDERGHSLIGDLIFEGTTQKTADQIAGGVSSRKKDSPILDEATEFLQEMLRENPDHIKISEAKEQAGEIGINDKSLQRARSKLGLVHKREGKEHFWFKPEDDDCIVIRY